MRRATLRSDVTGPDANVMLCECEHNILAHSKSEKTKRHTGACTGLIDHGVNRGISLCECKRARRKS